MDQTSSSRARRTCETCNSIDVRDWHRRGLLAVGRKFQWFWIGNPQHCGSIGVRSEGHAVILTYREAGQPEWKWIEQYLALEWTECNCGGRRPWFRCPVDSGEKRCGRRVAILYCAGRLFACSRCYGLAYECQRQNPRERRGRVLALDPVESSPRAIWRGGPRASSWNEERCLLRRRLQTLMISECRRTPRVPQLRRLARSGKSYYS